MRQVMPPTTQCKQGMTSILIIEDEEIIRKQLTRLLERNSFSVTSTATIESATELDPDSHDVILADIRLPGAQGTTILQQVRHAPVIIMTSHASVRSAVDSMRLGAVDYISKPFDHDELLLVIQRSLRENRLSAQNAAMRVDLQRLAPGIDMQTRTPVLTDITKRLENLDPQALFIYLHGERGSSREVLARFAHGRSNRVNGPLVIADLPLYEPSELERLLFGSSSSETIVDENNPALAPEQLLRNRFEHPFGVLRAAHTGTLVLRGVVELPLDIQQRICDRVKNNTTGVARNAARNLDVRLIALDVISIEQAQSEGRLSPSFAELFSGYELQIPPLRERTDDIRELAQQFLSQFLRRYRKRSITLSVQALNALQAYHWPGNANELKSVIERAVLSVDADKIEPVHLGLSIVKGEVANIPLDLSLDGYFRYFVLNHQNDLSETELAQKLGISRKALWERRQKMDLPRN